MDVRSSGRRGPARLRPCRAVSLVASMLLLPFAGCGGECDPSACRIACLGISPPSRGVCGADGVCRCDGAEPPDAPLPDARDEGGTADEATTPDETTWPDEAGGADEATVPACEDPPDGPNGTSCLDPTDCEPGLDCFQEMVDVFDGEQYFHWRGGTCISWGWGEEGCTPGVPSTCGAGGTCFLLGYDPGSWRVAYGCLDACDPLDDAGRPQADNCDCRDGYECSIAFGVCLPGCSNDRECCEIWRDGVDARADGVRQAVEVARLASCTNRCDRATWRCVNAGCPGGACAVGDSCDHDSDCPADATCLVLDWDIPGSPRGTCTISACDVPGRGCPAGTVCLDTGAYGVPSYACFSPCTPWVPIEESGCVDGLACYPLRDASGAVAGGCSVRCDAASGSSACGPLTYCNPVTGACEWAEA